MTTDNVAGYEDETSTDGYDDPVYDTRRSPSPAHASGGAYYPPPGPPAAYPPGNSEVYPPPGVPMPPPAAQGFTQHPNMATTNLAQQQPPYPMYTPQEFPEYPQHPQPGPPPNSAATSSGFPPPPTGPDHVSAASRSTVA